MTGIVVLAAALHASPSQATITAADSAANGVRGQLYHGQRRHRVPAPDLEPHGKWRLVPGWHRSRGTTFGIYAGGGAGNSFSAYRQFNSALTVSSTFSVDIGTTSINNGGSVGVLLYAGSQERGVLFFAGGTSFW